MTRKKKAASPKVKDGKQTLKSADTAGADYAHEQISGSYFADWVYDQLANPPANPLPLATKADARVIARNMLQQLEWDTKRELEPHTILGLSGAAGGGGARSKEVVAAFYKGFDRVLKDPKVVDWLADEILSAARPERVAEPPRVRASDAGAPYTIEDVNTLTGSRQHRKATTYPSLETAVNRARQKASGARSFAHYNVLDRKGTVVATFQGTADGPGARETSAVNDYIAVDRNDRRIAGPFRSRHEAERHVPPGGYVKFSSATRRRPPPPPSSYPMFRENNRIAKRFRVGQRVVMSPDALENYGARWQGIVFIVTHVATSHDGHPGFDPGGGSALYDLAIETTGEAFNNSLYDWELEPAPGQMRPRRPRKRL